MAQCFGYIGQTTRTTSLPLFIQHTHSGEPRTGAPTTNTNTHQPLETFVIFRKVKGAITQQCTTVCSAYWQYSHHVWDWVILPVVNHLLWMTCCTARCNVLEPRGDLSISPTAELPNLLINHALVLFTQIPFQNVGIQRHKTIIHVRILGTLTHKRARRPAISDSTLGILNSVYKQEYSNVFLMYSYHHS